MGSINERNAKLFFDFRFSGKRYREYTALTDSKANRKKLEDVLRKIESEISNGTFEYARYFPNSPNAQAVAANSTRSTAVSVGARAPNPTLQRRAANDAPAMLFGEFAERWYQQKAVEWRASYRESVRHILDRHLLPTFGEVEVTQVDRAKLLAFRTQVAERQVTNRRKPVGNGPRQMLSPATTNRIVGILSMILDEAAIEFGMINPCKSVKRLRLRRIDIQPFSMDEAQRLISKVRADYSDYLLVRMFTGLRSGEVNGLKWEFVDFERRQIQVRQTIVRGRTEYTKTDGSQREVQMSQPVFEALKRMEQATRPLGPYVFCTASGEPIDLHNFVKRVWNPLLRNLGLKPRRPYQMRHTCATLWLAAGENPQWIASQLGHTTTEMLFRVYSRFVPNLTRRDGAAFEQLLINKGITATADAK